MNYILPNIPLPLQLVFLLLFVSLLGWKLVHYFKYKERYNLEKFSHVIYFSEFSIVNSRSINSRRFKIIQNRISLFLTGVLIVWIMLTLLFDLSA